MSAQIVQALKHTLKDNPNLYLRIMKNVGIRRSPVNFAAYDCGELFHWEEIQKNQDGSSIVQATEIGVRDDTVVKSTKQGRPSKPTIRLVLEKTPQGYDRIRGIAKTEDLLN